MLKAFYAKHAPAKSANAAGFAKVCYKNPNKLAELYATLTKRYGEAPTWQSTSAKRAARERQRKEAHDQRERELLELEQRLLREREVKESKSQNEEVDIKSPTSVDSSQDQAARRLTPAERRRAAEAAELAAEQTNTHQPFSSSSSQAENEKQKQEVVSRTVGQSDSIAVIEGDVMQSTPPPAVRRAPPVAPAVGPPVAPRIAPVAPMPTMPIASTSAPTMPRRSPAPPPGIRTDAPRRPVSPPGIGDGINPPHRPPARPGRAPPPPPGIGLDQQDRSQPPAIPPSPARRRRAPPHVPAVSPSAPPRPATRSRRPPPPPGIGGSIGFPNAVAPAGAESHNLSTDAKAVAEAKVEAETRMKARVTAEAAQAEAAAKLQAEAEARAQAEAAARLQAEAEARAQAEAEARAQAQAEAEARAQAQAEAEAKAQAEAAAKLQAEAEARARAEAEAKLQAEAEARARAEAEAKLQAEAEARARAEVEAKLQAEAEARARAEAEAKLQAEAEARARAEAEAKLQAEAEARARAEAGAKLQAEAEARARAEAEAKLQAEAEARARAEAEAKLQAEAEAKARAEVEAKLQAEAAAKLQAEALVRAQAEAEANAMAEAQAEAEALAKAEAEAKAKAEVQARARTEAETTRVEAETKPRTTAEAQAKLLTESKHNSPEEAEAKDTSVLPPLSTSRGPTHGPTEATSLGAPPPIVRRARRAPQPPGSAKVESVRGDVYSAKALDANANSAINPHGRYRFQVGLIIGNDVNTDEASGGQRTATVVLLSPGTMQVRDFKALVLVKTWAFNSAQDMDANHWRLRHGGLVSAAAGPMSPHATQQAEETAELGRLIVEHGDLVSSGLVPTQLLLDEAETEEQTIRVWVEQGPPCTHTPAHQLVSEPTAEIAQKQAESEAQHQRLLEEEAEQLRLAEEAAARIRALAEAEPARPDAQAEAELPAVHTAEATDSDSKVERKEEPKPVVEQEPRDIAKQSAAPCTHPPGLDDDGGDASGENDDRALKPITENVDTPSAEEGTSTGPLNADPEQLAAAAAARIRSLQTAASMASKQESPALPPRRRRHVPTPDKLESEQHVGDVHAPIGARTEAVSPVRSNDADTAADDVRALSREAPSTVPPLPSRTRRSPSIALRAVQSEQLATSNPTSEASQSQSAELAANGEAQKRSNAKSIVSTQPEPLTVSTKFASTGDQAPLSQSKVSEMPQSPTANPVSPTTARGVSNFLQHNLSTPTSHQQLLRLAMSASQIYGLPPPPGLDDESESNNAWMEQDGDLPVDTALAGKPPGVWPLAHIRPTVVGETTPSQDNNGEGVFELSSHATALFTLREQLAQEQDDVSRAKVYGALLQLARGEKEVAAAQKRLLELQEQASVQEYTKNRAVLRAKELADREAQYDQQATHFDRTCDRDERLVLRRTEELRAQCHPAASRLRISEQLEKDKLRYMESTKLAMIKLIQKETRKRSELQRRFEDAQGAGLLTGLVAAKLPTCFRCCCHV